jgi:acyl-CoA synthetase (AMP-forming)/AMP-acid ligase II
MFSRAATIPCLSREIPRSFVARSYNKPRICTSYSHFTQRPASTLSLLHGPKTPELLETTLHTFLRQQAAQFPDNEAVVCYSPALSRADGSQLSRSEKDTQGPERVTYAQLSANVDRLAASLIDLGVQPQDRVGIFAGNSARYVELLFAISQVGAVSVLLNTTYTSKELSHALKHTGMTLIKR